MTDGSLDFVTKEIPIPAETMDREMQTDESCFDDNGYLPIVGKPPGRLRLKCENCRDSNPNHTSSNLLESCFISFWIHVATLKEPEEPEPQSKLISQHDSMPPLEHHESYMTSEANEQPPNYDEECLQVYPEESDFNLREKEIDFSKEGFILDGYSIALSR